MTNEELRHCLRNLVELCNPHLETYFDNEVSEALLEVVMEGKLRMIYDNGTLGFQDAEICENTGKEAS